MKKLRATCRIENQTGRAAIFYRSERGELCVYTLDEMHSTAHSAYYRDHTRPAGNDAERQECAALADHYARRLLKYDGIVLVIGVRLPAQ